MAFTKVDDNIIHYAWLNFGRDQNLVFVNSLGTSFLIWNQMIPSLSVDFNLLFHDKRGHGLSSSNNNSTTIDDYADDVIGVMDFCKIDSAHIVGLSIGGLVTYSLAHRFSDRCEKLIFSNTGTKIGNKEVWSERISQIKDQGLAATAENVIDRWLSDDYKKQYPHATKGYRRMFELTDRKAYLNACNAIAEADYSHVAGALDHESLFLVGSEDIATPPDFVRQNAGLLPKAEFYEFEGVAHLPCIEAPEKVNDQIKTFLL